MGTNNQGGIRSSRGRLILTLGAIPSGFLDSVLLICGLLSLFRGMSPISGIDLGAAFGMFFALVMLPIGLLLITLLALSRVRNRVLALIGATGYLALSVFGLIWVILSEPDGRAALALQVGFFGIIFLITSITSYAGWSLKGVIGKGWVRLSAITGGVILVGLILATLVAPFQLEATRQVLEGHTESVRDVAWSPDGAYLASASWDGTILIWDISTGESVNLLAHDGNMVSNVAWSPDGRLIASSYDKTVIIWDVETSEQLAQIADSPQFVQDLAWSPDSSMLAWLFSSDRPAMVWDVDLGQPVNAEPDRRLYATRHTVLWSHDNTLLAYDDSSQQLVRWNPETGERDAVLSDFPNREISTMAWSTDERYLAAGLDNTITIWDMTIDQQTAILEGHVFSIDSLAWSPDGTVLASASTDTIILWDMPDGTVRRQFSSHSEHVWSIAWSPDGTLLASAGQDGSVVLWFNR